MQQRPLEPAAHCGSVSALLRSLRNFSVSESAAFGAPSESVKRRRLAKALVVTTEDADRKLSVPSYALP
jgi:hypothetical protein